MQWFDKALAIATGKSNLETAKMKAWHEILTFDLSDYSMVGAIRKMIWSLFVIGWAFSSHPTAAQVSGDRTRVSCGDRIEADVVGRLATTWQPGTLQYATIQAGGATIELDPAQCPKITAELLEYVNHQGGGIISCVEARVTGRLAFREYSQTQRGKYVSSESPNRLVPVLAVKSLQITTLPIGQPGSGVARARKTVRSTTVGSAETQ